MNEIIVTIGKDRRGFKFGTWVLGELVEHLNCSVEDVEDKINSNPFRTLPLLFYYSAVLYKKSQKEEVDFTDVDVHDWIDTAGGFDSETVVKILDAFNKSMTKNTPKEEGEGKKKLTGS